MFNIGFENCGNIVWFTKLLFKSISVLRCSINLQMLHNHLGRTIILDLDYSLLASILNKVVAQSDNEGV